MTQEERVDFNDFLRKMAEQEARAKRADDIQLITFSANPEPNRKIPIARHPATGLIVFPDTHRLGGQIKPGETYFCEITDHVSPEGKKVHYANPIQRIDASFLFDLRPEQVAKIVEVLQQSAPNPLLEQARAQIQEQVQEAARPQIDSLAIERDAAKAEVERLKGEMNRVQEANAGLRRQIGELEKEHAPPAGAPSSEHVVPPVAASPTMWLPWGTNASSVQLVRRTAEEELEGTVFQDGHYFVHISPDRRLLFIHSHPEGNLPAFGGKLKVPGLAFLRPFQKAEALPARVDLRNGGLLVDVTAAQP